MIKDAKNGEFDMIAVWKIDRMSRNLSHLLAIFEELKEY
jgi:DNA invertase Pin-like site-specific DNA recombinase